jgi:hypothetical protein
METIEKKNELIELSEDQLQLVAGGTCAPPPCGGPGPVIGIGIGIGIVVPPILAVGIGVGVLL